MDNKLRELQLLELEIAKEIKRICELHEIEYFIVAGTLLGAVRHKGFIPWDDDMDIGMTTVNYKKFLEIAPKELDNRFFLQTSESDKNYANIYAKVRLNGTHMYEKVTEKLDIHNGVFVDVFPYELVDEKVARSKWRLLRMNLLGKMLLLKHGYDLNSVTENRISRCVNNVLKMMPISSSMVERGMKQILKKKGDNQKLYVILDGVFRRERCYPKEYFEEFIEIPFEDTYFKAPKEFDKYLTRSYGEYMQFPPEKEREKGHSISRIEYDNDYSSYFKD